MTYRKKDDSIPRILPLRYCIIIWVIVGISTWFIARAVIPDKTQKNLLLQQRERVYSEIYE